jgi:hypothetical protein
MQNFTINDKAKNNIQQTKFKTAKNQKFVTQSDPQISPKQINPKFRFRGKTRR